MDEDSESRYHRAKSPRIASVRPFGRVMAATSKKPLDWLFGGHNSPCQVAHRMTQRGFVRRHVILNLVARGFEAKVR